MNQKVLKTSFRTRADNFGEKGENIARDVIHLVMRILIFNAWPWFDKLKRESSAGRLIFFFIQNVLQGRAPSVGEHQN